MRDLDVLLPHRPPAVLLDEVVDYGVDFVVARTVIRSDSPYFDAHCGGVPAWVGIEYMAQAVAIWAGDQRLRQGLPVQVAFLLGTRSYRSNVPAFPLGAELTIKTDTLYSENNLAAFGCIISGAGIEVNARINAFSPDDPEAYAKSKR
jgi:predicted hotdog family 3-hydroxylacyl-ACP dehydratase